MSNFITLTCPSCGAKINVIGDAGRYRCDYCGNEHLLNAAVGSVSESSQVIRPQIPVPASVSIEKDGKSACLFRRWFSFKYLPMLFFVIPWDAFLCFWYSALFGGRGAGGEFPWIFFVFPLGHLAIGIGLTYTVIAGFINRTVVELTADKLSVWHEPLPWIGEKTIATRDIQQIYCKETRSSSTKGASTRNYDLYVVTRDVKQVLLLSSIESADIALFFEQQLEKWMRISDKRVVGEMKKDW